MKLKGNGGTQEAFEERMLDRSYVNIVCIRCKYRMAVCLTKTNV